MLSIDYSPFHREIDNYRIRAFLSEYSRTKALPPLASIKPYLDKAKELFEETKNELIKGGLIDEKEE